MGRIIGRSSRGVGARAIRGDYAATVMRTPDDVPGTPAAPGSSLSEDAQGVTETDPWTDDRSDGPVVGTRAVRNERRPSRAASLLLVILAVTALAAGLRLYHLSSPKDYVFDEVYYAKDACYDAGYPFTECGLDAAAEQTFTVHPPLGRWIIAGGEWVFGNRPFGWRIASALFGTLSVLLVCLLAWQLFASVIWTGAAGLLLATENLNLVQSRVSMLDIFVTAFILAGFLFLVLDRKWIERRTPEPPPAGSAVLDPMEMPPDRTPSPLWRPWRLATGVAMGAAAATKWSGFLALLAAILLSLVWERGRRQRLRVARPWWESFRDESFGILVFLLLVPVAVYAASYARWWADHGLDLTAWWRVQTGMLSYSVHLRAQHPYASRAWSWFLLVRPVSYYYQCVAHAANGACTSSAEILALGNPLIFWGSFITIPVVAIAGWDRRDWVAGFLLTAIVIQYVPWFAVARTAFLFYMAPITPFMVLALVYVLRIVARMPLGKTGWTWWPAAAAVVALSVFLCFFFWPILTGETISQGAWNARIWFCRMGGRCFWRWV
jgi:dolichyl-phosphate-mannose--protein O-mannosyl transferase